MDVPLVAGCAALGLALGPFLNEAIWRVPQKRSLRPPWREKGPRPPVVPVVCAVLFAGTAARFGWSWALPAYLVLFGALVVLSKIDLEHHKLPDRINGPLFVVSIPLVAGAAFGDGDASALGRALLGGLAAFVFLFALNLAYPRGMGMGDVKLSPTLGLYLGLLGWGEVLLGMFLAFMFGAVIGLGLIAAGVKGRKDYVPFGPFLALGTAVAVFWGEPMVRWYTGGSL